MSGALAIDGERVSGTYITHYRNIMDTIPLLGLFFRRMMLLWSFRNRGSLLNFHGIGAFLP